MSDVNLLVGSPGLFENVAQKIHKAFLAYRSNVDVRFIGGRSYFKSWHEIVVTDAPVTKEFLQECALNNWIARGERFIHILNVPNILTDGNELARDGRLFPDGPQYLSKLWKVLADHDARIILLICDIDRLAGANQIMNDLVLGENPWSDLMHRIAEAVPAAKLYVFAINHVADFALALPHIYFDPHVSIGSDYVKFAATISQQLQKLAGPDPTGDALRSYLADLEAMRSIDSVRLTVI